jgi:hypothetical protein
MDVDWYILLQAIYRPVLDPTVHYLFTDATWSFVNISISDPKVLSVFLNAGLTVWWLQTATILLQIKASLQDFDNKVLMGMCQIKEK